MSMTTPTVAKCVDCPREGDEVSAHFRAVRNYGQPADHLERDWLLEVVHLCDACAVMRDDVL